MTKLKPIEVPLIQGDLMHSETILQIANTLDILKHSIDNVFDHVNKSIDRTKQSLQSVQSRHQIVCEQIDQLKNIQKAVTIQNCSKYPYQDQRSYEIDFQPSPAPKLRNVVVKENDSTGDHFDIENKLKFYHVKTHDMLRKNIEVACDETLGKLPENIDSVTSCMLFNTCQNVYEKYVIIDPLSSNKNLIKENKANIKQIKMEEAPKSLNLEEDLLANKQSYVYTPSVENVPVIELPLDLPDLTGFADDFRYTDDDEMFKPNIGDITDPKPIVPITAEKRETANESTSQVNETTTSSYPSTTPQQTVPNVQSVEAVASIPAAPPPPPLPPASPPITEVPTKSDPSVRAPVSDSLHSNLMEAIRNAGGTGKAKLKTVDPVWKSDISSSSSSVSKPAGGDLMSDLHAKLLLRRKGISGQAKESFDNRLMETLLNKIPPPPAPGAGSSSSEEDDENNEAEWDD